MNDPEGLSRQIGATKKARVSVMCSLAKLIESLGISQLLALATGRETNSFVATRTHAAQRQVERERDPIQMLPKGQ